MLNQGSDCRGSNWIEYNGCSIRGSERGRRNCRGSCWIMPMEFRSYNRSTSIVVSEQRECRRGSVHGILAWSIQNGDELLALGPPIVGSSSQFLALKEKNSSEESLAGTRCGHVSPLIIAYQHQQPTKRHLTVFCPHRPSPWVYVSSLV